VSDFYTFIAVGITLLLSFLVASVQYQKFKEVMARIDAAITILDAAMKDDKITPEEARKIYEAFKDLYDSVAG